MKRLLSLVGLSIALALLVAACGTAALSRPEADEATQIALGHITVVPTNTPTDIPATATNTPEPTETPTDVPPTNTPTVEPTIAPSNTPTVAVPTTSAVIPSEEEIAAAVAAADAANGQTLTNVVAPPCSTCHNFAAETQIVGPGLWNLANRAGTRVTGQGPYTYVYVSILHSQDFIVDGFAAGLMPVYAGVISDDEVYDIIAYLWTLHD